MYIYIYNIYIILCIERKRWRKREREHLNVIRSASLFHDPVCHDIILEYILQRIKEIRLSCCRFWTQLQKEKYTKDKMTFLKHSPFFTTFNSLSLFIFLSLFTYVCSSPYCLFPALSFSPTLSLSLSLSIHLSFFSLPSVAFSQAYTHHSFSYTSYNPLHLSLNLCSFTLCESNVEEEYVLVVYSILNSSP